MAIVKTPPERRLLQLQSKELTLRSGIINRQAEHLDVKAQIATLKSQMTKGRK